MIQIFAHHHDVFHFCNQTSLKKQQDLTQIGMKSMLKVKVKSQKSK